MLTNTLDVENAAALYAYADAIVEYMESVHPICIWNKCNANPCPSVRSRNVLSIHNLNRSKWSKRSTDVAAPSNSPVQDVELYPISLSHRRCDHLISTFLENPSKNLDSGRLVFILNGIHLCRFLFGFIDTLALSFVCLDSFVNFLRYFHCLRFSTFVPLVFH